MARPKKKVAKKVTKKKKKVDKSLHNKGEHTPIAKVEAALLASGGILSHAAKSLGITRQAISQRVKNTPRLEETQKEATETIVDLAFSKLITLIQKEHFPSIRLALITLGKERGFVERQEFTGKEGKPLPHTLLIERFERAEPEKK